VSVSGRKRLEQARRFPFVSLIAIQVGIFSVSLAETPAPLSSQRADFIPMPHPITWATGAGKWVGYWGRRESVRCPPGGKLEGTWGTDIYTDDSSICTAAVHAGLISVTGGGVVMIEMRPDAGYYGGTTRNGVTTGDWREPWTGSYVFVHDPSSPPPAIAASGHMKADSWMRQAGRVLSFYCAPFFQLYTVYGTDFYTDDSYICSAAVHAGVLTQKAGGMATIRLLTGRTSFEASLRNGVASLSMAQWSGQSFIFVVTPPGTPLPPTEDTPVMRPPGDLVPCPRAQGNVPL
jgi:hypothetical protein